LYAAAENVELLRFEFASVPVKRPAALALPVSSSSSPR